MKSPRIKHIGFMTSLSVLAVAGCTSSMDQGKHLDASDAHNRIEREQGRIAANAPALTSAKKTNRPSNINVQSGLFLGDTGYRASNGNPLPARFETPDGISLRMGDVVNIEEFAQTIERITGIRVDYSDIAITPALSQGGGEAETGDDSGADSTIQGAPGGGEEAGTDGSQTDRGAFIHPTERTFRISHQGKLSTLLDQVASRMNSDWVYEAGRIQFLGPQTVTYTLWSLPSSTQAEATVGGGGSDSVFGGSSPATVTSSTAVDYWSTFEAGLTAIIPNGGAAFSVNRTAGTVIVTGPQNIQRRVQSFVETENARLSRQVAVKIDVVAFTRARSDDKSTSLSGVLSGISSGFNMELLAPANAVEDSVGLSSSILTGKFAGAAGAIRALSKAGKVSVLTSSSVTAANNTPTPLNITNERAYLAGSVATTTEEGTEVELETGIVSSGINAVVTPRIMSSGEVVLQYTMNITELKDIVEFQGGGTTLQLPEVISRNFMQTVNIDSGDSLVIASFDQQSANSSSAGPLSPELWGVGGSTEYGLEDTKVMIIMTPVVLEKQNKPRRR